MPFLKTSFESLAPMLAATGQHVSMLLALVDEAMGGHKPEKGDSARRQDVALQGSKDVTELGAQVRIWLAFGEGRSGQSWRSDWTWIGTGLGRCCFQYRATTTAHATHLIH